MEEKQTIQIKDVTLKIPVSSEAYTSGSSENRCAFLELGRCTVCTCTKCTGGFTLRVDEKGNDWWHECSCRKEALSRWQLKRSGLEKLAERCTFDSYIVKTGWQEETKRTALEYLDHWKENSFFVYGHTGCGKTHICTAICNGIIKKGKYVLYFPWVRDATALKMKINDPELYGEELDRLLRCDLLYIDDLLKSAPTDADLRLMYEIVNGRYNEGKPMIISTERSLAYIKELVSDRDRTNFGEAVAGRIVEATGDGRYCLDLSGAEKNVRLHPELIR